MASWESYLQQHRARFLDELVGFLRIPSISALPDHASDVQRAAAWVAERLSAAGLEGAKVMPTGGHPVVVAEWLHAPGKPTVLIYGHFDVQPADPVALWTTPPFEPTVREGRVYARGASDNKGNLFASVLAVEALLKTTGVLPVNVKFLVEGQEEIGSPQVPDFVAAHKELLACDLVINADGGQWSETEPALLLGLRGLCALYLDVYGPSSDLHSGVFGGSIANPLHALAELLASMHTPDGKVAVEGFYDDVAALTPAERAAIAAVPMDEAAYKAQLGVTELYGEPGYSTWERTWVRPTLELNGMWGGFQGEGSKTVLPSEAHAKITCRLVPNQDPKRIAALLKDHVARHTPKGVRVVAQTGNSMAYPYLIPADHPGNLAARDVLAELYGREPYHIREGGSVPICEVFERYLGAPSVMFGFGLHDEHFHAPNEFFRLSSFDRGQVAHGKLLERLGQG